MACDVIISLLNFMNTLRQRETRWTSG